MSESLLAPSEALFPVSYLIGNNQPGAPRLQLDLLVYTPDRSVNGHALITQATNPPLEVHEDVWGTFSYQAVQPPSEGKILLTVRGNHGGPHANSPVQFELQALLDQDWQKGTASYRYYNGQRWIEENNVPVVLELQRIQGLAGVNLQTELHNATLEAVIATGDVAQLKQLASGAVGKALDQALASTKSPAAKAAKKA
ncbi:DUF1842 domain-containing protein [Pseudomonas entomophila]|uniref:DUF1842 domain-containing protein n=2 Tax=Pseudomonas entomophila TaxID=312306 RepID=Q1I9J5_PSEE4|nr:DUF1842 domain-containing protein [Pseudomonas entomophila]WMW03580.1 DUF1842 domain-containing protein [Pseudomonas entomophila]CAK15681.1 conserved hypothetical protein [Pseudomonas entomophila L48]